MCVFARLRQRVSFDWQAQKNGSCKDAALHGRLFAPLNPLYAYAGQSPIKF